MADDERAAAKAERRTVIESNKAWTAATTVRRDWLTHTFAHRRTAPAGAAAYLARVVSEGWGHERATSDAFALAGFPARDNVDSWTGAAEQRHAVTEALATATPKRALQIGLAVAVAMWEARTHPNTWRAADEQTVLTLTRLQEWATRSPISNSASSPERTTDPIRTSDPQTLGSGQLAGRAQDPSLGSRPLPVARSGCLKARPAPCSSRPIRVAQQDREEPAAPALR